MMNLIEMSFTASILIVAIMIIRALFLNKLPKITFPILWGIVLIRLIFPFSFDTGFSFTAFWVNPIIRGVQLLSTEPSISETMPSYLENTMIQPPSDSQAASPVLENDADFQSVVTTNVFETISELIITNWLIVSWLIGVILCVAFFILSYWKSLRKINCAFPISDEFLDRWKSEQRIKRPLSILVSDQITTPLALGVLKPKIILPDGMDLQNKSNLDYVLTHELYHIKRFDVLWKLLAVGVVCIHWFNPLVWVAFMLINRDLEISCDAWVVKTFGKHTKKTYAYALISMAEYQSEFTSVHSYFARYAAEERIESIMKTKKTTVIAVIASCAVIGLLTFSAFAAPTNGDENINDEEVNTFVSDENIENPPIIAYDASGVIEYNIPAINSEVNGRTIRLLEFTTRGMTFRAGDLGSRHLNPSMPPLLESYLTLEEFSILTAETIYDRYGFSTDGLILDTWLIDYSIHDDSEIDRVAWYGMLLSADFSDTLTTTVPDNSQIMFIITVCAASGEVLNIFDNQTGDQLHG